MTERAENPRCTDFCRTGGSRGHYDVGQPEIEEMQRLLAGARFPSPRSREAADFLYGLGYGYHAIADALGVSHEQGFRLVTGQG